MTVGDWMLRVRAASRVDRWIDHTRPHLLLPAPRFTLEEVTAVVAQWLRRINPRLCIRDHTPKQYAAVKAKLSAAECSRPDGVTWFADAYIRSWLEPIPWREVRRWDLLRLYAVLRMREAGPLTPADLEDDFDLDDLPREADLVHEREDYLG